MSCVSGLIYDYKNRGVFLSTMQSRHKRINLLIVAYTHYSGQHYSVVTGDVYAARFLLETQDCCVRLGRLFCHRSCAYTLHQTLSRSGVYNIDGRLIPIKSL